MATMLTPFVIMAVLMLALLAFRGIQHLITAVGRRRAARQAAAALAQAVPAPPMLASDRDREQAAQRITHAVGEGRLDLDEAEHRIDVALRARWDRDLASVLKDLPELPAVRGGLPRRAGVLAGIGLLAAIAVAIQAAVGLWELWPVAVAAAAAVALRKR